ncbi:MAG: amino acid ABC transporter substrate-binding protein [Cyanobacteria bacterium J06621_12]
MSDRFSIQGFIVKQPLLIKLKLLLLGLVLSTISGCQNILSQSNQSQSAQTAIANPGNRLEIIKQRGKIICGINDQLLGFSYKEADGSYSGISVDLCKAIAAALFDDPTQVEFRHLQQEERFSAVVSGEVDILSRNTTWNLSRDTSGGLDFPPTNFYDGQGLLVRQASGIKNLLDLRGKSICVPAKTTTEVNLAEQMRKYNVAYKPLAFENPDEVYSSYESQRCDAVTSDRSELVARRSQLTEPDVHQVLDLVISKEPLGPVIANGEPAWFDVVTWVSYAMVKAEELDISSNNVDTLNNSQNPEIKRFLGLEGEMGNNLELPNDFARRTIKHVGNYSEVYERNVGRPFGLERGANALWKDGGLMHSPPFR